jgi:hypothetical protein
VAAAAAAVVCWGLAMLLLLVVVVGWVCLRSTNLAGHWRSCSRTGKVVVQAQHRSCLAAFDFKSQTVADLKPAEPMGLQARRKSS